MTSLFANIKTNDIVTEKLTSWGISFKDILNEKLFLDEKQNFSKYLLENEILIEAQSLFKPFNEMEIIIVDKCEPKKLYDFYFICKNMTVEREEELIDAEIDLEDRYPAVNFDFIVIRKGKRKIDDVIKIKSNSLIL